MRRHLGTTALLAVMAAACSGQASSPATPTSSVPATTLVSTTAQATTSATAVPTTTSTTAATTTTSSEAIRVTFDGSLHPSEITLRAGDRGLVEFHNETDQEWRLVARGEAFAAQTVAAGAVAVVDFAALDRGVCRFAFERGNVRANGTVDNRAIVFEASDLELIASWDGRLGFAVLPEAATTWRFQAVGDGIIALPFSSGLTEDFVGRLSSFFASTTQGAPLRDRGLVMVLGAPDAGDARSASAQGEAALAGDAVPANCAPSEASPVQRSGLAGRQQRYACGDLELVRGFLVVPGEPAMLVYYDAVTSGDEDRFHVETALDSIEVDPGGGLRGKLTLADQIDFALRYRASAALFDEAGTATIAIRDGIPQPLAARVGPWNSGDLVIRNESAVPALLSWRFDDLEGGEVAVGRDLAVDISTLAEGRSANAYTVSFGRTGRVPGWIDAWAFSPERETVEADGGGFTVSVPSPGAWFFFGAVDSGVVGSPFVAWAHETGEEPRLVVQIVDVGRVLSETTGRQLTRRAAAETVTQLVAGADCSLLETTDAARAGLLGTHVRMQCEGALTEIGVVGLFLPGRQFVLVAAYAVGNDEDRFYVNTAIDGIEVADTVP